MSTPRPGNEREDWVLWTGLLLVLAPLLTRATSVLSPFPGWEMDPLLLGDLRSGITPAWSIGVDVCVLIGAALLMLHARARGAAGDRSVLLLGFIGCVPVLLHALALGTHTGSIGDARIGAAWMSGVLGAIAVWHASVDGRVRRVVIALLLGLIAMLAARGAQEWFVEHPAQVASFKNDRARILASHGWTENSSMAKGFERRVLQPEASGWFGLSNVYAAFAAAGTVAFFGLILSALRAHWRRLLGPAVMMTVLLGLGASIAALYFAQSKGGVVALGAGVASLGVLTLVRGPLAARLSPRSVRRIGGVLGVGAVAGALALIAVRGAIGERIGELSVLFRYFYAQASVRIFAHEPLLGVGPDGFQRAYALFKTPISPEEVTSPHSILFDYVATLGVLGLAWCSLVVRAAWSTGSAGTSLAPAAARTPEEGEETRSEFRAVIFLPAVVTILASYAQGVVVTPAGAVTRFAGLLLWAGVAWGVHRALASGRVSIMPVAAGALALLAHMQIDVEASWVQSAGLVALWLGVACTPPNVMDATARAGPRRCAWLLGGAVATLGLAGAMVFPGLRALRWESSLSRAVESLAPSTEIANRLELHREAVEAGRTPKESIEHIASDVARMLDQPVAASRTQFEHGLIALQSKVIPEAVNHLLMADAIDRGDSRSRREASRLLARLAENERLLGQSDKAKDAWNRALGVHVGSDGELRSTPSAGEYFVVYLLRERRATLFESVAELQAAARALENGLALDPYNLDFALRRFRLAQRLGDPKDTLGWARRVFELDEFMRLDREVRGLSESDRRDVGAVIGTGDAP